MAKENSENLNKNLSRLVEITEWFNNQDEIDVEEGLKKVKEAAGLIRSSKSRLREIENEFEEIKKEIEKEESENDDSPEVPIVEEDINPKDIPF